MLFIDDFVSSLLMMTLANADIPVLGFAAYSGTGKTTLLTQLIPLLAAQKLRTALIKHSHHNFQIDNPGKDSFRLRAAGATPVMLVSKHRRAIITEFQEPEEPRLADQLSFLPQTNLDLILVEGFKHERFPKIEINRPSLQHPLLFPHDDSIIAIATDTPLPEATAIPILDLNNPIDIAQFVVNDFLRTHYAG